MIIFLCVEESIQHTPSGKCHPAIELIFHVQRYHIEPSVGVRPVNEVTTGRGWEVARLVNESYKIRIVYICGCCLGLNM